MELEHVEPLGSHKTVAHLNYGDKRSGFYEVEMKAYPAKAVAAGKAFREARTAADLGLREAARLLSIRAAQLSSIERGQMRIVNKADADAVLATYSSRSAPPAGPSTAPLAAQEETK